MNILMSFILSVLAGLGTVLGSLLSIIPFFKKTSNLGFILSFSGSILLFICIFDILPSSIPIIFNNYNIYKSLIIIILSFLLGTFVLKIINTLIEKGNSLKKIGVLSFIALLLHNIPEGIVTFMSCLINFKLGLKICIAILIHNIPEGLCISVPLNHSTHSPIYRVGVPIITSLAEPFGALIAYLFLRNFLNEIFISILLIIIAGIMIELSINNIFKYLFKFENKKTILIGVLFSLIYVIGTLLI